MPRKLSVFDVLAIGSAVARSVKRVREGIQAAKDPASPGGVKVTPLEAIGAVVKGLLDATPAVYERVTGDTFPDDVDILDVIADL